MLPFTINNIKKIIGKGRGKKLGVPTINFSIPSYLHLPYGVYAGHIKIGEKSYAAAIHYGPRPVFAEENVSLEAHIIDQLHLLDEPATADLTFIKFIRKVRNFKTPSEMIEQIKFDLTEIKEALKDY